MKTHLKVALVVLAGFGLGAFMIAGAHAQAAPPHYEGDSSRREQKEPIAPLSEFTLTWSGGLHRGDCTIFPGSTLTVRSDGTATWRGSGFSTSSDDAFGLGIALDDVHDVNIYQWQPFYSPTLSTNAGNPTVWARDLFFGVRVPAHQSCSLVVQPLLRLFGAISRGGRVEDGGSASTSRGGMRMCKNVADTGEIIIGPVLRR